MPGVFSAHQVNPPKFGVVVYVMKPVPPPLNTCNCGPKCRSNFVGQNDCASLVCWDPQLKYLGGEGKSSSSPDKKHCWASNLGVDE